MHDDETADLFDSPGPAKPTGLAALEELFGPVISSYSRAQAIDDGALIDVSETAREAGITFPTVVTAAVWETCVATSAKLAGLGQSERGRLWDVLYVLSATIRGTRAPGDRIEYRINVATDKGRRVVELWAACGPGDTAEPVITIMLQGED